MISSNRPRLTVTIDGTNGEDTIGISDYVGDGNEQGQTGYHMMQMTMAGRQFLINGVLSDYYIFTLPTESLIVKGHSGADTITIYSLDPEFGLIGAPGTETTLGIYGNEDGAPELFPDLAYDEVIFAGDVYTNGAYLEVFAETIKQADNVTVSTYKADGSGDGNSITWRARKIGAAELENLSPVMVMTKEVYVEIGENATLKATEIYILTYAEDRSFADILTIDPLLNKFVVGPALDELASLISLPFKVLFKETISNIVIKEGAQILGEDTVEIESSAKADATGVAKGTLFSIGYAEAKAHSSITIESDVVISSENGAIIIMSGAEANAKMGTETKRTLSNVMSPDSAQFAISIAVAYADSYSHIDVAAGAVITAGNDSQYHDGR